MSATEHQTMSDTTALQNAKRAKLDEFYTQYADIQTEMNAYLEYNPDTFRGKTVLLPCDDPEWSNFTRYFAENFAALGLKKLISTSYAPDAKRERYGILFDYAAEMSGEKPKNERGKIFVLDHDVTGDGKVNFEDIEWKYLDGDGDFRSDEVKKLRDEKRQAILAKALEWVSKGNVRDYLKDHRYSSEITDLTQYFESVIAWIDGVFKETRSEMCGLEWGRLYETYHVQPYDPDKVWERVESLFADADDGKIQNRRNIFEYVLGGEVDKKLLKVRMFSVEIARKVYRRQTEEAKTRGVSNCPDCANGHEANARRIYAFNEMEADHVSAWSRGGDTTEANCQMLCKHHNRVKGNC